MESSLQILVVDDEPAIRQVLVGMLSRAGYSVDQANDGEAALEHITKGAFDLVLSDIKMPRMDGIELVRRVRALGLDTQFLMMTAFASMDTAIEAMRAGAYDYLIKPLRKEDVLRRLAQLGNVIRLQDENRTLRQIARAIGQDHCPLGSPSMQRIERQIQKVAMTDHTVLITGESGTGKSVHARAIHDASQRSGGLFVPVNCGSIPEQLLESEFFGHVKGAFTGADRIKKGLFVQADQGTLFLDEIGELPQHLQVKLLHVLEQHQVRPVGSEEFRKVDVRIVAATNKNLQAMVREGTFREDLFFRLNVFNIHIPPLRERPQDLETLLDHFLTKNAAKFGDKVVFSLAAEAKEAIMAYHWPGNTRELENALERASVLTEDGVIGLGDLPDVFARFAPRIPAGGTVKSVGARTLRERVQEIEAQIILEVINECGGDRKQAAKILGIGLSSLYRKLELANVPKL
ncbi:MAG: sigma-54-dependent Fis family transcriptional regulator [Magnetococcales bacterium]|nr:sigma-54-dependent Fis family transcriptional regulator [Magnetococcales bacterium]MBF0631814.1 sigma-54-dependent Fis family transcriptional regulator [Magnetococcales bacterium]